MTQGFLSFLNKSAEAHKLCASALLLRPGRSQGEEVFASMWRSVQRASGTASPVEETVGRHVQGQQRKCWAEQRKCRAEVAAGTSPLGSFDCKMQDHKASEGQKEAKGEKSKEAQREGGEGGEGGGTFAGLVGTFRPCTWETQEFRSPREIYALPKRRRASDQSEGRRSDHAGWLASHRGDRRHLLHGGDLLTKPRTKKSVGSEAFGRKKEKWEKKGWKTTRHLKRQHPSREHRLL